MDVSVRGGSFSVNRPDLYLQNAMSEAKAGDEMIAADRDEYVPDIHTNTFDRIAELPLHTRYARFLNPDGATRTEVYWAAPSGALAPDKAGLKRIEEEGYEPADYLMVVTSVQKDAAYRERIVNHHRITLPDVFDGKEAALPAQTTIAEGDSGLYHLHLQWDQYVVYLGERSDHIDTGPRLKSHVLRLDSLRALNADPRVLEMSDLRPLRLTGDVDASEWPAERIAEHAIVMPARQISTDTPLGLYFELYHLAYGTDDRAHYTVTYDIERKAGGTLRLRRDRGERTSFSASFESPDRNVRETLLLDLSDWEGRGALDITVRVTDNVSGQSVQRTIGYEIR